jgi:hypothetical protein
MTGGSIIKFEDLGRPATVLIEKISDAIEGIYKPVQIKRIAQAQAEADKIKAKSQIEINELTQRALSRFVAEEAKKQDNMEKITEKALPLLEKSSDPQKMEDDWITNFFDKCRIISDKEMQTLWSKVLAGEANSPGTFSKRTVNLMSALDKTDAQLFTNLCGFVWIIGNYCPLIFNEQDLIYNNSYINFNTLNHLDDIGLITFGNVAGFKKLRLPKNISINYYGTTTNIEFKKTDNNELSIGKAIFTKAGEQLARICGAKPVDGFFEYIVNKLEKDGLKITSINKKE